MVIKDRLDRLVTECIRGTSGPDREHARAAINVGISILAESIIAEIDDRRPGHPFGIGELYVQLSSIVNSASDDADASDKFLAVSPSE